MQPMTEVKSKAPASQNPALSPQRLKKLLKRMTLAEKAAQMMCLWQEQAQKLVDARGNFRQSDL